MATIIIIVMAAQPTRMATIIIIVMAAQPTRMATIIIIVILKMTIRERNHIFCIKYMIFLS